MKKLFGGLDISWKKIIIFAVIAGGFTALMAIIPSLLYTSFISITTTFEVWILFGIIIIMNSKSNREAALKCFVFFLISQPLVYLCQVPFSRMGWDLFMHYKYWFIWTILCLPMGYIGYYMKKDKWWGYLILFPMILLTAYSYMAYLSDLMFYFPKFILVVLFCIIVMIIYPLYIFNNKKIRIFGVIVSVLLILGISVYCLSDPPVYDTHIMFSSEENYFDENYTARLVDDKYGKVEIIYMDHLESYVIHAQFKKEGKTEMIIESDNDTSRKYSIDIKRTTYDIEEIQ